MNIVVCIKQILDTTDTRFDADSGRLKRDGLPVVINALDEYAVEEGLRLKEAHGGQVTVISMGGAKTPESLKHAVAMGADASIHLMDDALAGADAQATAYTLAQAIAKVGEVDLILCGAESIDGNTSYVGPAVATMLQLPYVTFVEKIEEIGNGKMIVRRMMEEGYDRIESPTPALITVVKGINEPRITSLKGKMRAKKHTPEVWAASALEGADLARMGAAGATTRVLRTFPPDARPQGAKFEGEPAEIANQLFEALKN